MAKLWNLNSTIPGYIAFAAIMVCWQIIMYNTQTYVFSQACYFVSLDVKLKKVGMLFHIDYHSNFTFNKRLLIIGKDLAIVKLIFRSFDEAIFRLAFPKPTHSTANTHIIDVNNFLANMKAGKNVDFENKGKPCFLASKLHSKHCLLDFTLAMNNLSILVGKINVKPATQALIEAIVSCIAIVATAALVIYSISTGPIR